MTNNTLTEAQHDLLLAILSGSAYTWISHNEIDDLVQRDIVEYDDGRVRLTNTQRERMLQAWKSPTTTETGSAEGGKAHQ